MNKYFKYTFFFIMGVLITVGTVYGVNTLNSSTVFYNGAGKARPTNVQDAIDDVYSKLDYGTGLNSHVQMMNIDGFAATTKELTLDFEPTFIFLVGFNGKQILVTSIYRNGILNDSNWAYGRVYAVDGKKVTLYHASDQYSDIKNYTYWLYATDQPIVITGENALINGYHVKQMNIPNFTYDNTTVDLGFEPTFIVIRDEASGTYAFWHNNISSYQNWAYIQIKEVADSIVSIYHAYTTYKMNTNFWLYATDIPIVGLD